MNEPPKTPDWSAMNKSLYDRNQQRLREYADVLRGPAAKAIWPNKENEKEKPDE